MLLNLFSLINKYSLNISGVLHIGAHFGEEYKLYKTLNINKLLFFEPVKHNFNELIRNVPEHLCINVALGNYSGIATMHVETANLGQSSSILEPDIHLKQYPHIQFPDKEEVQIATLDSFDTSGFNMINMDVQGYELEVLKGGINTLKNIDYIICEVNIDSLYKNCAQMTDIDNFLYPLGFIRLETSMDGGNWGDAFYLKREKTNES
jgi:FkbM family methyltransferase